MSEADGSIIIDTEIQTDGMAPGTKEVEQAIRSMADTVKKMGIDAQMALQKQINAVSRMNSQYAQQEKKIEAIRKKMEELAGKKVASSGYEDLIGEIRALETEFDNLVAKEAEFREMGYPLDSGSYKTLQKELDEVILKLESLLQKKSQMESTGTAYVDQTGTQQYLALQNQLTAAEARLFDMNNRLGTSYTSLKIGVAEASETSRKFQQILASSASPMQKLKGILGVLKKELLGTDEAQKKVAKSNQQMNKGLKNTSKHAGRARMTMGRMMAGALTISLAMRAVMTVMEGFGEGLNNLVQYSDDSNRAMSALMSGMTQLKNSFATAFSPIIEYVQPALSRFISLISEAVSWTAQFFAALTGKDTFVKAVKVQQDYADSLDKTKDETKDAAKETKKAIAPFDELIQIIRTKKEDNSDKDKGELKPEDMFTTEEVTNSVKLQAEEIKKLFGSLFEPIKSSWDNHGTYAVQAAKAAFDNLKQLAGDIGASFLQVWKDEGYGEVIASNLIITFGNLANTVANLAKQFDDAWVKADTGTNIIRHLGDILVTISDFFRRASEEIRDWAAELDFGPLLRSFDNVLVKMNPVVKLVGDALLWLLKNVLLPVAKWAIECAVPAVLDLIAAGFDLLASVLEALEPLAMWLWDEFLQPFGEWAGKTVIAAIQKVVEWITKFSDWIDEHQEAVESMTLAVLAFFAAWNVVKFIDNVSRMMGSISGLMGILGNLDLKFGAIVLVITTIIYIAAQVAKAWDKMTPGEKLATKIIAVAGAIALVVAAVAAFSHDLVTLAIAAGIAAIAGLSIAGIAGNAYSRKSVSARNANPYSMASDAIRSYSVPRLATGTVVPPRAGEFLAVLGDNKRETEVVSPLSTMKQAMVEALEAYGGMGGGNGRPIQVDMYLDRQRLGRVVYELNNQEQQRVGVRLVTEGR